MFFYVSHCSGNLPETRLREFVRLIGTHHDEAKPFLPVIKTELKKRGFDVCSKVVGFEKLSNTTSDQLGDALYGLTGEDSGRDPSITLLGKFELVETTDEMENALNFAGKNHQFTKFIQHGDDIVAVCEDCRQMRVNTEIRFHDGSVTIPLKSCQFAAEKAA